MKKLGTVLLLSLLSLSALATDVLLPVYDAAVGQNALFRVQDNKAQCARLCLIVNPNSGPGSAVDAGMRRVIVRANALRVRVLFYIDAKAFPGDGLTPPSAREHVKTPVELVEERHRYSVFYGALKWDGWFIDDFAASMKDVALTVSNWPGTKVLNPGTAMVPPTGVRGAIVVISEQAKAWPRALTAWEVAHRSQCAVMGLAVRPEKLQLFIDTTAGMAFRYASPLDDDWKHSHSAYSVLTPYLGGLFK